ncbi:MAG: MTH1187 family thiamine-binding protein [Candidatus Thermoplasmatota archaeon]|nr:MTH1187 family thiamine-binding protein [Candidatus Thermoplasmatota archaeon]
MIIGEISTAPLDKGMHLREYVKAAIDAIKNTGVKYETSAMSTTFEAKNLDELLRVVKDAHNAIINMGSKRVYTVLKIDDRRDTDATMETKLKGLE